MSSSFAAAQREGLSGKETLGGPLTLQVDAQTLHPLKGDRNDFFAQHVHYLFALGVKFWSNLKDSVPSGLAYLCAWFSGALISLHFVLNTFTRFEWPQPTAASCDVRKATAEN